jgi:hypothetical protein
MLPGVRFGPLRTVRPVLRDLAPPVPPLRMGKTPLRLPLFESERERTFAGSGPDRPETRGKGPRTAFRTSGRDLSHLRPGPAPPLYRGEGSEEPFAPLRSGKPRTAKGLSPLVGANPPSQGCEACSLSPAKGLSHAFEKRRVSGSLDRGTGGARVSVMARSLTLTPGLALALVHHAARTGYGWDLSRARTALRGVCSPTVEGTALQAHPENRNAWLRRNARPAIMAARFIRRAKGRAGPEDLARIVERVRGGCEGGPDWLALRRPDHTATAWKKWPRERPVDLREARAQAQTLTWWYGPAFGRWPWEPCTCPDCNGAKLHSA